MNSKSHIPVISAILYRKGVKHVVIAPGSRNAPLIQSFYTSMPDACISIVDERSAAYFALGIALKTQTPVVIITTSGTAVLNLAPAIAEAYHQGVPLLILTADRPPEWINQQDNQTISQKNIFANNCKASFETPLISQSEDNIWFTNRIINEAFNISIIDKKGPVHINIPLAEPLYNDLPAIENVRIIDFNRNSTTAIDPNVELTWKKAKSIIIVCGQNIYEEKLQTILNNIAIDNRVVILAESVANINGANILVNPDMLFQAFETDLENLKPDLVIYFGGQIISKRIKNYLRNLSDSKFWQISAENIVVDTFKKLTNHILSDVTNFFTVLVEKVEINKESDYSLKWHSLYKQTINRVEKHLNNLQFSDLWLIKELAKKLNSKNILFAGNSSAVRYLQILQHEVNEVFSNRGTSGIDGCISTSAGIASVSGQKVIAIVGDLSFVYDSNGLWNKDLPDNLKIIVINNKGGGIFSILEGPSEQKGFKKFFEAHHPVSIGQIAVAFGVKHFMCTESGSFNEAYNLFYTSKGAAILEITTQIEISTTVFQNFMNNIKTNE